MKKITLALGLGWIVAAASAAPVPGQGTWSSTLKARDVAGNSVALGDVSAIFFYDTVLDVTWLRDARLNAVSGGSTSWSSVMGWADSLEVGGFSDWRLANAIDSREPGEQCSFGGTDCGYNPETQVGGDYSELAHLFQVTLGNRSAYDATGAFVGGVSGAGWGLENTAYFNFSYPGNPTDMTFWYQTKTINVNDRAWMFRTYDGIQTGGTVYNSGQGLALRDGDVLRVPEPDSLPTVLLALMGLWLVRRRATTKLSSQFVADVRAPGYI